MANTKANNVEVWLFKGKRMLLKKVSAKMYGGIVQCKDFDPTKPVVWLGQQSYMITNMANKKTVLFYDTLSHMLFKPRDMGDPEESVDMVMQTSQNVLLAGKEAKQALGIEDAKSSMTNIVLGLAFLMFLMFLVFVYLMSQHIPGASTATTTITQITTGGLVPGGPQIVPSAT